MSENGSWQWSSSICLEGTNSREIKVPGRVESGGEIGWGGWCLCVVEGPGGLKDVHGFKRERGRSADDANRCPLCYFLYVGVGTSVFVWVFCTGVRKCVWKAV